jgi:iron complex outermembrane receptor protein
MNSERVRGSLAVHLVICTIALGSTSRSEASELLAPFDITARLLAIATMGPGTQPVVAIVSPSTLVGVTDPPIVGDIAPSRVLRPQLSTLDLPDSSGAPEAMAIMAQANPNIPTQKKDSTAPPPPTESRSQKETPSQAQSMEEVVVTARKRNERVLDIPESITAISSTALVDKGIETMEDVGRQTPNLQLNTRQDNTTDVVIRGVGAYGDVLGVGFNIDDVPNFTDQSMRLIDLERVEILKGPQGTLYGASSIGGLVRYVSKKPSMDWSGEASTEVGRYGQINLFAAQNFPIIADKLALRVSAYDSKSDGYITNGALGIPGDPVTDYGTRAALLYQPTDAFNALLTLRYSDLKNGFDQYPTVASVTSFTYDVPFFQESQQTRPTYGSVLALNDQLGPLQLTSISSYTWQRASYNADFSLTPPGVPGVVQYTSPGNRPTEVATQEFRLTSPSGGNFDWLVGIYGDIIKNVMPNRLTQYNVFPTSPPTLVNDFDTKRTDGAAFGTLNYHLGAFTLGGGLRLTETQFRANVYVVAGGAPNQDNSITSRAALPKFTLSYALPNDELLYANVAKGEEPGAVNTQALVAAPYKSETAISYEIGTKGQALDRQLEYELSAFYVSNTNHQYETNVQINGGLVQVISNIGESRTYGTELNVSWRATPEITLSATGGYLNAKWQKAIYFGVPVDGNTIPNAPSVTASLSAAYWRPVFDRLRFDANIDMGYTSSFYWDPVNTPGSAEPSYWIGNARIALGAEHSAWQVAFRVSNFLGTKYWTEYYPDFAGPGVNAGAIGAPRLFIASITVKY